MRISELASTTGTTVATLKFYLREGLLPAGQSISATRAEYDEEHVRRVGVIRALTELAGLSLARARDVLALIDMPGADLYSTLGAAIAHLPPATDDEASASTFPSNASPSDTPRARAALDQLGLTWYPNYPAVTQLERALAAAEAAGIPLDDARLARYGSAIRDIAAYDIQSLPADNSSAVSFAVLGTAVYEPVIAALRRLYHHDIAARSLRR